MTAIAALLLKELGAKERLAVIGGGVLLFSAFLLRLGEIKEYCDAWLISGGAYSSILMRGLGICLAVEISAGICRECGAELAARTLSMLGRAEILLLALPLLKQLTEQMEGIL